MHPASQACNRGRCKDLWAALKENISFGIFGRVWEKSFRGKKTETDVGEVFGAVKLNVQRLGGGDYTF